MKNKFKACILFLAIHICAIAPMKGQCMHTIIFADTNDPSIGE